jgi:hypothetical protein
MAMAPLACCIVIGYRKSSASSIQTNPSETARSIYPVLLRQLETRPPTNRAPEPEPEPKYGSGPNGTYGSAHLSALTIKNKFKNTLGHNIKKFALDEFFLPIITPTRA